MPYKDPQAQREAQRRWYENRDVLERRKEKKRSIQKHLRELKIESGCVDCGYDENHVALDFDHRPDEFKKFALKEIGHRSWKDVLNEVAKCDVRCANCHRVKTEERRLAPIVHG